MGFKNGKVKPYKHYSQRFSGTGTNPGVGNHLTYLIAASLSTRIDCELANRGSADQIMVLIQVRIEKRASDEQGPKIKAQESTIEKWKDQTRLFMGQFCQR